MPEIAEITLNVYLIFNDIKNVLENSDYLWSIGYLFIYLFLFTSYFYVKIWSMNLTSYIFACKI